MKFKELMAALKAKHAEMETMFGKTTDESLSQEERDQAVVAYGTLEKQYNDLYGKAVQAKTMADNAREIANLTASLQPETQGLQLASGKAHTFEVDSSPERDLALRKSFFLRYCQTGAKALDGNQFEAIRCKNQRAEKESGVEPVSIPEDMRGKIMAQVRGGLLVDAISGKVILSTDATGGSTDSGAANLLAPDFRPQLLQMPIAMPTLYDLCRVIPAVNGSAEWPVLDQDQGDFGGVAFTWKTTEGADKAETEPVFKDFTVRTHELSGWTELSLTALRRSAIALESTLTQLFQDACRQEWSKKILNGLGDANHQPEGVLVNSSVATVNRAVADQVAWADLTNMEYAVRQGLRFGARYVLADTVEKYLKQSVDDDKRPLYTADVHSPIKNLLAGYPYQGTESGMNPVLGDAGDVVFGNFNNYAWAIEEDIAIARSDHAEFKKGRVVFRLICFVGGKVIFPGAFKKLGDVAS